jgi:hypothetical protein
VGRSARGHRIRGPGEPLDPGCRMGRYREVATEPGFERRNA